MKDIPLIKLNIHTFTGELSKEIPQYHVFIYGNNMYMRNMKCFLHKSLFSQQRIRSYSILLENNQRRLKNLVYKTLNNYQT
jgi:citrate lyase synthetase